MDGRVGVGVWARAWGRVAVVRQGACATSYHTVCSIAVELLPNLRRHCVMCVCVRIPSHTRAGARGVAALQRALAVAAGYGLPADVRSIAAATPPERVSGTCSRRGRGHLLWDTH